MIKLIIDEERASLSFRMSFGWLAGWEGNGVAGGSSPGVSTQKRIDHVTERCRNLLSLRKYGIVFFPTSKEFWKDANQALNPSVPEAGRTVGEPIQCPLNRAALAILNKVPKPSLK